MNNIELYSKVQYPQLRLILINILQDLFDTDTQNKEWVSDKASHKFWDTLRFRDEFFRRY